MSQSADRRTRAHDVPEPAWDVAYLFPPQGHWTEHDYFALDTNRIVELSNGRLEVAPMTTTLHQMLVMFLYEALVAHVRAHDLGTVLVASLPVRLWPGQIREPDVVFMHKAHAARIGYKCWDGADLVMEVVSDDPESRKRDLVEKRREYARGGIAEYWIVDPVEERVTVLRLAGKRYVVHCEARSGETAESHLLPGFALAVDFGAFKKRRGGKRGRPTEGA
jgi:Uma2 family endonuclease